MMLFKLSLTIIILANMSLAVNNWDAPCFQGSCTYEIPASSKSLQGNIVIQGSSAAISDISPVSGWEILDCLETSTRHDVRMVCSGNESDCSHLFQNGAEHTVVRLPENCGSMPFARVSNAKVSENQELPSRLKTRLMRRDGSLPTVHSISLDPKFIQSSDSPHGEIRFHVLASSNPELFENEMLATHRSQLIKRGIIGDQIAGMIDFIEALSNSDDGNTISFNKTQFFPVDWDEQLNLFNSSVTCGSGDVDAQISVDVNPKFNGNISMHFVAVGTLSPVHLEEFGVSALMSLELDGSLNITANVQGDLSTGRQTLVTIPLEGLAFSVPGIVTVGPVLNLDAEADTALDVNMDLGVGMSYSASNLQFAFPSSELQGVNRSVTPGDTPLKLSVSPGVQSLATVTAHIIPSLDIEVSAFDEAEAGVFLDFDTSATLDLSLNTDASGAVDSIGQTTNANGVSGCIDAKAGFSVTPGVRASVSNLFSGGLSISILSDDFTLFQECLPAASESNVNAKTEAKTDNLSTNLSVKASNSSSLQCLAGSITAPVSVINQIISVSSFNSD